MLKLSKLALGASALALMAQTAAAESWAPYPAQAMEPAFAADAKPVDMDYVPVEKAEKAHNICVSFPHMKDAYWLGVDYGVVEQARAAGVKLNVLEAGGYTELAKQISQIEDCVAGGAEAVIIGSISFDGLNNLVKEVTAKGIPVIDVINGISAPEVTAKSLVSFYTMGHEAGVYLAAKHPAGSDPVKVAFFPGPAGAGWVEAANEGFHKAVEGSALQVLDSKFGDTGKEVQMKLVEDTLQAEPDVRYIVGTAVTAEVAQGIVRDRGLQGKTDVLSFYLTPGVYQGIQRGMIMASPADSTVIQGRIAVDQAIRAIEGKEFTKHVGPKIFVIDETNLNDVPMTNILPPDGFSPVFKVD